MRYIFFGTPEFAAKVLGKLIDAHVPPKAIVCNPDRPYGRRGIITPPPTKIAVEKSGEKIDILQPEKIDDKFLNVLQGYGADFYVVCAYSKILPADLVAIPRLGVVGVHPSVLPKLRGPSPIQSSILEGFTETGVTLYILDNKVDHGEMIAGARIDISETDTYESLSFKIANLAGDLLVKSFPEFTNGAIVAKPQDEAEATYTKKFTTDEGYVDSKDLQKAISGGDSNTALPILRKIRALNPDPGVFTIVHGKRIKLLAASIIDGRLELKVIQFEGKKPMLFSGYQKPLF
ncbi:MAG: methionyl-tRNA formyltransferase [Candidatus Colwellbacteria bacterium]|nr:methionyl-tRNA formyltransferase [Candidatus Colwellbacteria bacterium]